MRRYLPRRYVRRAHAAEQVPLNSLQSRIGQAVAEEPPNEQQKVQVAIQRRRLMAVHPETRLQQRPVEASAVVGDQPGARRSLGHQGFEQSLLLRMIGQGKLQQPQPLAFPPGDADEKGDRSGGAAEARRFGVQAEQWNRSMRIPRYESSTRSN